MQFGIIDTADNTWIGDSDGPKLFDDFMMARVAAQVFETQVFGTDLGGQYKAVEFTPRPVRLKEDIPVKMNALKALRRIEGS